MGAWGNINSRILDFPKKSKITANMMVNLMREFKDSEDDLLDEF